MAKRGLQIQWPIMRYKYNGEKGDTNSVAKENQPSNVSLHAQINVNYNGSTLLYLFVNKIYQERDADLKAEERDYKLCYSIYNCHETFYKFMLSAKQSLLSSVIHNFAKAFR